MAIKSITYTPFTLGKIELCTQKTGALYEKSLANVSTSKWIVEFQDETKKEFNITLFNGLTTPQDHLLQGRTTLVQLDDLSQKKERKLEVFNESGIVATISSNDFIDLNYYFPIDSLRISPLFNSCLETFVKNSITNPDKISKERYTLLDPTLQTATSCKCKACVAIMLLVSFLASIAFVYVSHLHSKTKLSPNT